MGGANGIDMSIFKGRKVVNLDSEVEGVLTCGCAGGIEYEAAIPVHREKKDGTKVTVRIHGLNGGHSGSEIHQQRGNAHKMMGRFLYRLSKEVRLHWLIFSEERSITLSPWNVKRLLWLLRKTQRKLLQKPRK